MSSSRNIKGQFAPGREVPIEEQLKIREGLRRAWGNSCRYIGDLVKENPYIYNCWRSFMFTKKGKKAGASEEWHNFRTFYNDVIGSYVEGKRLRRRDVGKPFSKDNFIWLTDSEYQDVLNKNTVYIEFNGDRLSIRDWADRLGVSPAAIKNRYYKHPEYSTEEILYGKGVARNSRLPKDYRSAESIRAKASKMISAYKLKDKRRGLGVCDITIEWMVRNIITQPCVYCGDTYRVGCDRIDNNKGHTMDNVVPSCVECNAVRNNLFTYREMLLLGKTIREIKSRRPKKDLPEVDVEAGLARDVQSRPQKHYKATYCFDKSGTLCGTHPSIKGAAESIGVDPRRISEACANKRLYRGYYWSHKNKLN